jgi:hypothetical protein
MLQAYPIPKSLWETLEAVLFTKGVALAKEVAAELNVSPKDIIASLNIQESTKFILASDDDTAVYQCQAVNQHGAVYMRCRAPTLGVAPRLCNKHSQHAADIPLLPLVRRLVTSEATYVYNPMTNEVFTLNGTLCGSLKNTRLTLFDIDS